MHDVKATWESVCGNLRSVLNQDTYDRWIANIVPLAIDDEDIRLGVSNSMFSDWLSLNYKDLIVSTLGEVTGRPMKVVFETGHGSVVSAEEKTAAAAAGNDSIAARPMRTSRRRGKHRSDSGEASTVQYNPRFTFDSFVVGDNNKFAHAACLAVERAPGKTYNPLFIHGGVGLGKTHLLQAIAQGLLGRKKRARIEYLSSEQFSNAYIEALRDNALPAFRRRVRRLELLLIDDVHFFSAKEGLQEEFFHTFNALHNAHRQIVLSSDRPPHEINGLEKRLVSRFEWGLAADIQSPDLETRMAILRKKQAQQTVKLDDDVLLFVAQRIKSNIRRLEGALTRLVSFASLNNTTITEEVAEQLLGSLLDEEASNPITVKRIQKAVAEHYDIRLADMTSSRRPQSIAFPRQVAMYLSRELTGDSSTSIAEDFSRNHATILHAAKAVKKRLNDNPNLRRDISVLKRRIRG